MDNLSSDELFATSETESKEYYDRRLNELVHRHQRLSVEREKCVDEINKLQIEYMEKFKEKYNTDISMSEYEDVEMKDEERVKDSIDELMTQVRMSKESDNEDNEDIFMVAKEVKEEEKPVVTVKKRVVKKVVKKEEPKEVEKEEPVKKVVKRVVRKVVKKEEEPEVKEVKKVTRRKKKET